MRCIARGPNSGRRSAGFTLIEVLVVAPMVILMLGTIIAMLVNLSSSAMRASAQASLQNDVLAALDMIEQDVKLSTAISSGMNSLTTTNLATSSNPLSASRHLINKDSAPCSVADNISLDQTLSYVTTYRVDTASTPKKVLREVAIAPPSGCTLAWQRGDATTLLDLGSTGEYTLTSIMDGTKAVTVTLTATRKVAGEELSFTGVLYAKSLNIQ